MKTWVYITIATLIFLTSSVRSEVRAESVIYVDVNAGELPEDGSSWCRAYRSLDEALFQAFISNKETTIYIAGGEYIADTTGIVDPRDATFFIHDGQKLLGGYAGCGASDPDKRDFDLYETILSGDLSQNDDPSGPAGSGGSCCTASETPGCDDAACEAAICALDDGCCSRQWYSYCADLAATLCCTVCGDNTTACENVYHVGQTGVGVTSNTIIDGLTFYGGTNKGKSFNDGGAGLSISDGSPIVRNCIFRSNRAQLGAGVLNHGGDSLFENCQFTQNRAPRGAGMFYWSRDNLGPPDVPTFSNCSFNQNIGDGLQITSHSEVMLKDCLFASNQGSGLANFNSVIRVIGCRFAFNTNSGVMNQSTGEFINCVFFRNSTTLWGGGGAYNIFAPSIYTNCIFSGNTAAKGGGLYIDRQHINLDQSTQIRNCTFTDNHATASGGGIRCDLHNVLVENSIFWGNTAPSSTSIQLAQANCEVRYSDIEGGQAGIGLFSEAILDWQVGNLDVNPNFASFFGQLQPSSLAINAGDPNTVFDVGTLDYDGYPRILCGRVDMGAYEFGIGDYDCDDAVDLLDYIHWGLCMTGPDNGPYDVGCEAFDFNGDDDIDLYDFREFQSLVVNP